MINNETHAWEQITIYLNGVPTAGITELNFKDKKDKKPAYGAGAEPRGSGHGNYEASGDFTLTKAESDRFETPAAVAGKTSLDYIPFTIVAGYKDKVADGQVGKFELAPLRTKTLENVEITDRDFSHKQADGQLVVKYTFIAGKVR